MGLREALDSISDLDKAGWGIIFAHDTDPAIIEALQPLVQLRQRQAGDRFRMYSQDEGFQEGESKTDFLTRNGVGPGPADPDRMPYYLLIVGSPERIPYSFQVALDVQYAVGRIYFETLDEYANYAQTVLQADTERPPSGRLAMFSVINPNDSHTQMATEQLTTPLMRSLSDRFPQWMQRGLIGEYATKAALTELLYSSMPPSLLFCVSHGITYPPDDPRREAYQGALLCADWPGPGSGPIPASFYFSAADLTKEMNLAGMIAFFYASYGAGTPEFTYEFGKQGLSSIEPANRPKIASRPFLAQLPMKMLGRSHGLLAVIGLIDSAWGYSSAWSKASAQTTGFEKMLTSMLNGFSLGFSMEHLNQRYAELSTDLASKLEDIKFGGTANPIELTGLWAVNNDARNITLLGDPAVSLSRLTAGAIS